MLRLHELSDLHIAVLDNDIELVEQLIEQKGFRINSLSQGVSALHCAAMSPNGRGATNMMELLVRLGARVNQLTKKYNQTALMLAAKAKDANKIIFLLRKGAGVKAQDYKGRAPIYWAAKEGNARCMQFLLDHGQTNVNVKDCEGQTPLHMAAQRGNMQVVKMLLDKGAQVNAADKYKQMPIHHAAAFGDSKVMRLLIRKGAQINSTDVNGRSPLHWAALNDNGSIIWTLMNMPRCDVNLGDGFRMMPLHLAVEYEAMHAVEVLCRSNRINIDATDRNRETPLHLSIYGGNHGIAKRLVSKGANLGIRNYSGKTPLQLAQENRNMLLAHLLMNNMALKNRNDFNGSQHMKVATQTKSLNVNRGPFLGHGTFQQGLKMGKQKYLQNKLRHD